MLTATEAKRMSDEKIIADRNVRREEWIKNDKKALEQAKYLISSMVNVIEAHAKNGIMNLGRTLVESKPGAKEIQLGESSALKYLTETFSNLGYKVSSTIDYSGGYTRYFINISWDINFSEQASKVF